MTPAHTFTPLARIDSTQDLPRTEHAYRHDQFDFDGRPDLKLRTFLDGCTSEEQEYYLTKLLQREDQAYTQGLMTTQEDMAAQYAAALQDLEEKYQAKLQEKEADNLSLLKIARDLEDDRTYLIGELRKYEQADSASNATAAASDNQADSSRPEHAVAETANGSTSGAPSSAQVPSGTTATLPPASGDLTSTSPAANPPASTTPIDGPTEDTLPLDSEDDYETYSESAGSSPSSAPSSNPTTPSLTPTSTVDEFDIGYLAARLDSLMLKNLHADFEYDHAPPTKETLAVKPTPTASPPLDAQAIWDEAYSHSLPSSSAGSEVGDEETSAPPADDGSRDEAFEHSSVPDSQRTSLPGLLSLSGSGYSPSPGQPGLFPSSDPEPNANGSEDWSAYVPPQAGPNPFPPGMSCSSPYHPSAEPTENDVDTCVDPNKWEDTPMSDVGCSTISEDEEMSDADTDSILTLSPCRRQILRQHAQSAGVRRQRRQRRQRIRRQRQDALDSSDPFVVKSHKDRMKSAGERRQRRLDSRRHRHDALISPDPSVVKARKETIRGRYRARLECIQALVKDPGMYPVLMTCT